MGTFLLVLVDGSGVEPDGFLFRWSPTLLLFILTSRKVSSLAASLQEAHSLPVSRILFVMIHFSKARSQTVKFCIFLARSTLVPTQRSV